MKDEDRPVFLELMARAKVSLPCQTKLTSEEEILRLDVFWEALKNYSIESVFKAFRSILKESDWFPTPKSILQVIYESRTEYIPEDRQIGWMAPTEEGREIALELMKAMSQKWSDEDKKHEEERKVRFEENRIRLKKQADLLNFAKEEG